MLPMPAGMMFQTRAAPHPGPRPVGMIKEKNPMLAGLCWKFAATNSVTARKTATYFPMIERAMTEKKAAILELLYPDRLAGRIN